jgi:hypothetical protein
LKKMLLPAPYLEKLLYKTTYDLGQCPYFV